MPFNGKKNLRIIGGKLRGSKLELPKSHSIRPTTDRVRETVFNWLQGKVQNYNVLDLFAGSGAMGLEALSRGANHVVFVDKCESAVEQLRKNLKKFNQEKYTNIVNEDAEKWLKNSDDKFDLIFLDPPFGSSALNAAFSIIEHNNHIKRDAWVYIEKNKKDLWPVTKKEWHIYRESKAGEVLFRLMQRKWYKN